jgi:hypothetical protein
MFARARLQIVGEAVVTMGVGRVLGVVEIIAPLASQMFAVAGVRSGNRVYRRCPEAGSKSVNRTKR